MSVHCPKISHLCRRRSRGSLLSVTLSLGLLFAPEAATAEIVPVCDRHRTIRDVIVSLVPEINDCADVTEAHLAEITYLGLEGPHVVFGTDMGDISAPLVVLRPGDSSGLTSLTVLVLSHNALERLPPDIFSDLSSLEDLYLGSNRLMSLPPDLFSGLSSLKKLWLISNRRLNHLPEGLFSGLSSLEALIMQGTPLASLPPDLFSGLSSLKILSMGGYPMPHLPADIFSGLASLEELYLNESQLSSLPEDIFSGLASLEELHLGKNQLTSLPESLFSGLASLKELHLNENQLISLPGGIFSGLTSLEKILLYENQLTSLPEGLVSGLSSLESLSLGSNLTSPLPIIVSLEWVDEGRFQARVHTGAPFEIRFPISVTNGKLDRGESHVTIPTGRENSDVFSVSRRDGTVSPVTVEIAQFPDKPKQHGYELVKAAVPLTVLGPLSLDFPHFANGASIDSDLVFVNIAATPIQPAIYFFDREGNLMAPASVVDVGEDQFVGADGALTVRKEIEPLGELTVSTHGRGPVVTGSVRVLADGPMGGFLRFDNPDIGVAGVGAGFPAHDAIFPARRSESGINTGAAIRNLGEDSMTVNCQLTQKGQVLGEVDLPLAGNGQTARFIDELFHEANTENFVGSVRCRAPEDALFAGVALEMDFRNQIFTTLPMVPVPQMRTQDYTQLHFPHFANGASITSDLVLVNVASDSIRPALYFYDSEGGLIAPSSVVDMVAGLQVQRDGGLTVQTDVAPLSELTLSTHGRGDLVTGSVKVIANGPIGGFLRFTHSEIGVAGVGVGGAARDVIFPARNQARGIRTGMALRNLKQGMIDITCQVMQDGRSLGEKEIPLAGNGQTAQFIHELFPQTVTSGFVGSVRCTAPEDGRFTGLALEMDDGNRIFTTLPVLPVPR